MKLIYSLSKSAKVSRGLKHEALKTIYKGTILPLLLYGVPVWIEAMKYAYNRLKYIRVQIYEHTYGQSISYNIKRSTVHCHRNDTHYYQN